MSPLTHKRKLQKHNHFASFETSTYSLISLVSLVSLVTLQIVSGVDKFVSLHVVCDVDKFGKFGSLEVYILCVMMISLEVWKFGSIVNERISLEVWKFANLKYYFARANGKRAEEFQE